MLSNQQLDLGYEVEDKHKLKIQPVALPKFPTTRFQGSKRKILPELATALSSIEFKTVLDMFSGSGIVSLMFRYIAKTVSSNDFMLYNQNTAKVFQTFTSEKLNSLDIRKDLNDLLHELPLPSESLVSNLYKDIYFIDDENLEIDRFCQNINNYDEFRKNLYIYAVGQALIKKRPYNLFHRANLNMRTKEVKRSFGNKKTWETPIIEHAIKCVNELKKFPIKEMQNSNVTGYNSKDLESFSNDFDLIYLDPPYINSKGTPVDYSNFYHFLEGLCNYELYKTADESYPHKPLTQKYSSWLKADTALEELRNICLKWPTSTIVLSYRSDGLPTPEDVSKAMSINGRKTEIHSAGEYKYALSKTNTNEELIIISTPNKS